MAASDEVSDKLYEFLTAYLPENVTFDIVMELVDVGDNMVQLVSTASTDIPLP